MKSKLLIFKESITHSKTYFAVFKLPMILITALLGFIMEFVIELPFMVLCMLDRRFKKGSSKI